MNSNKTSSDIAREEKKSPSIKLDNQEPISQQKETLNITNNNTTVKQLNTKIITIINKGLIIYTRF